MPRAIARAPFGGGSTKAPGLFINFTDPTTPTPPAITVARAGSTATYWDNTGTMQVAPNDTLRIDYGPTPSSTQNYFFPSVNTLSNSWTALTGGSWIRNSTTAPDSTNTAALFVSDTSNGAHQITLNVANSGTFLIPNTQYTASAYVQAGTSSVVDMQLRVTGNWVGGIVTAHYDLVAVTATPSANGTATITPLAGSWFRITVTGTTAASGLTNFPIFLYVDNVANTGVYVGNGESAYFWGVQFEQGSVARSYIPTTTVAVINFTSKGLLVEEPRTNSIVQSSCFTSWVGTNVTGTQNALLAPDGTTSATQLTESSATGVHQWAPASNPALVVNVPITFSYFVKDISRRYCGISMFDAVAPSNAAFVDFDLALGTANAPTIGGAALNLSATIAPYGTNGWYRVSLTVTLNTVANSGIICRIRLENSLGGTSYTGDGVSSLYAWGAQVEVGSSMLSYIPTTTVAVARGSEDIQMPLGTWFRVNQPGTLFAECMFKYVPPTGNTGVVRIDDTTSNNEVQIWDQATSANIYANVVAGGVSATARNHASSANTIANAAIAWDGVNQQVGESGVASPVSAAGMPSNLTRMLIGRTHVTAGFWVTNGWVRKIAYYPRAMSAADLIAVTT